MIFARLFRRHKPDEALAVKEAIEVRDKLFDEQHEAVRDAMHEVDRVQEAHAVREYREGNQHRVAWKARRQ